MVKEIVLSSTPNWVDTQMISRLEELSEMGSKDHYNSFLAKKTYSRGERLACQEGLRQRESEPILVTEELALA